MRFNVECTKDSLDMTDADRQDIVRICSSSRVGSKIIITHGTDTMDLTASALLKGEIPSRRTIVLTGALRPACLSRSDAEINLGLALGVCLFAEPGIYVAMNGVYRGNNFVKDELTGEFKAHQGYS